MKLVVTRQEKKFPEYAYLPDDGDSKHLRNVGPFLPDYNT
jgi:hypothetical protein